MVVNLQPVGGLVHRGVLDEAGVLLVKQRNVRTGIKQTALETLAAIVRNPVTSRTIQNADLRVFRQLCRRISRNDVAELVFVAKDRMQHIIAPVFRVVDLDHLDTGVLCLVVDAGQVALTALHNDVVKALLDAALNDFNVLGAVVLIVKYRDVHVTVILGVSFECLLQPSRIHIADTENAGDFFLFAGACRLSSICFICVRAGGGVVAGGRVCLLGAACKQADQHQGRQDQCEYLFHVFHVPFSFSLFHPAAPGCR